MNQEVSIGIGLIVMAYFFLFSDKSEVHLQSSDDSNYLITKYGLTENEYRTFTYISDPIKRDQYLNYIIRSKQKN